MISAQIVTKINWNPSIPKRLIQTSLQTKLTVSYEEIAMQQGRECLSKQRGAHWLCSTQCRQTLLLLWSNQGLTIFFPYVPGLPFPFSMYPHCDIVLSSHPFLPPLPLLPQTWSAFEYVSQPCLTTDEWIIILKDLFKSTAGAASYICCLLLMAGTT